jgi:hypothetical protein
VDANEGWKTREQALEMIQWLAADGHIQFVEQPMPASTPVKDWVWLKERSPLPIFGDESYHTAKDIETAAECFHGINVKLVKSGGVSGGFDALKAARKAGLKTMIGCMIESSILISAAAHLPNCAITSTLTETSSSATTPSAASPPTRGSCPLPAPPKSSASGSVRARKPPEHDTLMSNAGAMRGAALAGFLAVALGAFGAHGLKETCPPTAQPKFGKGRPLPFCPCSDVGSSCRSQSAAGGAVVLLSRGHRGVFGLALPSGRDQSPVAGRHHAVGGVSFLAGWLWLALAPAGKSRAGG